MVMVVLHGAGWALGFLSLVGFILYLWVDAIRHLFAAGRSYLGWFGMLTQEERIKSLSGYSGRPLRFMDISGLLLHSAPEEVRSCCRRNVAWFVVEGAGSVAVFFGYGFIASAFA